MFRRRRVKIMVLKWEWKRALWDLERRRTWEDWWVVKVEKIRSVISGGRRRRREDILFGFR